MTQDILSNEEALITQSGYQKIEEELEYLKATRRLEVAERIKVALSFGDISENAEYDEAKNEQAQLEERISKLENIKCNLTCINLEFYKERLKKFYTLRIEMIEIFLNDDVTDNTMFKSTDSQLFKEKSREYLDYQYDIRKLTKSLRSSQNYNYSDN